MNGVSTVLLAANAVVLLTGRYSRLRRTYIAVWMVSVVPAVFLFVYTARPVLVVPHLALFPAIWTLHAPVNRPDREREEDGEAGNESYSPVPNEALFRETHEIDERYRS